MRTAVVSDIHGNLVALRALLADIRKRKIERTVCLGDVAAFGPQPREVIAALRRLGWPCVLGNTDEDLVQDIPEESGPNVPAIEAKMREELDNWTRAQLTDADRRYLSSFKRVVALRFGVGKTMLSYHGTIRSNRKGITVGMPDEEVLKELGGQTADIFAGGHTHFQMVRSEGSRLVINPGSVGLPFERDHSGALFHPVQAHYAIVNSDRGLLGVELLRINYELSDLKKAVRDSGLPNQTWWLSSWR